MRRTRGAGGQTERRQIDRVQRPDRQPSAHRQLERKNSRVRRGQAARRRSDADRPAGYFSLRAHSEEERAAREFLVSGQACAVVLVADAGCLERSLILALRYWRQENTILCLNLMDGAAKKGIEIDVAALERELGIPVIPWRRTAGERSARAEAADTPSGGRRK